MRQESGVKVVCANCGDLRFATADSTDASIAINSAIQASPCPRCGSSETKVLAPGIKAPSEVNRGVLPTDSRPSSLNPVLEEYPSPASNVFLMMRFRDTEQHRSIGSTLESVLAAYSMNAIRADAKHYYPELWPNVRSCMDACLYGIAVFEQIDEKDINPNVSLELGYMLACNKRCLLLKEQRVQALQSDLLGHLYRKFDSYNIPTSLAAEVGRWLTDLGIAKRPGERLLLFVSEGGTCRCAMAKAITRRLLEQRSLRYKWRVESLASGQPTMAGASPDAQEAMLGMLGENLLANHRTARLTPKLMDEADLILVMSESLLKGLPPNKTHVLKRFLLGLDGDVSDPYRRGDSETTESRRRYDECANQLHEMLTSNLDKIVDALAPP